MIFVVFVVNFLELNRLCFLEFLIKNLCFNKDERIV